MSIDLVCHLETTVAILYNCLEEHEQDPEHKKGEHMKCDYCCRVTSSTKLYLSRVYHKDLSFSWNFIEANKPLYNILEQQLRLNMPNTWVSVSKRANIGNRTPQGQNTAQYKRNWITAAKGQKVGNSAGGEPDEPCEQLYNMEDIWANNHDEMWQIPRGRPHRD